MCIICISIWHAGRSAGPFTFLGPGKIVFSLPRLQDSGSGNPPWISMTSSKLGKRRETRSLEIDGSLDIGRQIKRFMTLRFLTWARSVWKNSTERQNTRGTVRLTGEQITSLEIIRFQCKTRNWSSQKENSHRWHNGSHASLTPGSQQRGELLNISVKGALTQSIIAFFVGFYEHWRGWGWTQPRTPTGSRNAELT